MKQLQKGKKMLEDKLLRLYVKAACFKMSSDRGDTNFISIIIILGIVIILAGAFIGFKDKIMEQIEPIINGFQLKKPE